MCALIVQPAKAPQSSIAGTRPPSHSNACKSQNCCSPRIQPHRTHSADDTTQSIHHQCAINCAEKNRHNLHHRIWLSQQQCDQAPAPRGSDTGPVRPLLVPPVLSAACEAAESLSTTVSGMTHTAAAATDCCPAASGGPPGLDQCRAKLVLLPSLGHHPWPHH